MRVGELQVTALTDGTFIARPRYFGPDAVSRPRSDVFDRAGAAWLPIGSFLVRAGGRTILVDAGLGPDLQQLPEDMYLVGGQLLTGLRAAGVGREEITDAVCTHLHVDHVGWLFDEDAAPVFPAATIWFGAGDWHHFVAGPGEMAPHIERGFRGSTQLKLLDQDTTVARGADAIMTPGHTPGHLPVALDGGPERFLLLGDVITCPVQLEQPTWHSMGDVDPEVAERTRERLWRDLADPRTTGVGAHFPELRSGRVASMGAAPLGCCSLADLNGSCAPPTGRGPAPLGAVVDELVEDVQHERAARVIGVRATNRPDRLRHRRFRHGRQHRRPRLERRIQREQRTGGVRRRPGPRSAGHAEPRRVALVREPATVPARPGPPSPTAWRGP